MIKLHGKVKLYGDFSEFEERSLHRICTSPFLPPKDGHDILFCKNQEFGENLDKYKVILTTDSKKIESPIIPIISIPDELNYLEDGDIICLNKNDNFIRVLYRKTSHHNSFLLTERCNHYCIMCSQPPRDIDDGFLAKEIIEAISLMDINTKEIGLSGGEPTLLGDSFFDILTSLKMNLPMTSVHILSNGKAFKNPNFAKKLSDIKNYDLMIGIPLYSDIPQRHNFVVQSDGAFDDTIRGILNLKSFGVKVEIRFVLHKHTAPRLREFSEFIKRNLLFVDHVAFMGLETIGFAKSNISEIWIDPVEYMDDLEFACHNLAKERVRVSVYNSQLCLLKKSILPFYRHSISDWKNEFLEECDGCYGKSHCCGFFASNQKYHSNHIKKFETSDSVCLHLN